MPRYVRAVAIQRRGGEEADRVDYPASCTSCGRIRDPDDLDALAWSSEHDEPGRVRWLCPRCAREHIMDIEAKLPTDWW
jgi:predicted RNA-binding Zn-ribbon protein involved in translation (DUF1610 family)